MVTVNKRPQNKLSAAMNKGNERVKIKGFMKRELRKSTNRKIAKLYIFRSNIGRNQLSECITLIEGT